MLFSARISTKELARLSHRLATSLEAGIDMRAVWQREASGTARASLKSRFQAIDHAVAEGDSLAEAMNSTGDFFPPLFRELTNVGEQTGRLPDVFSQLHHHYEDQIKRRRIFLAAIAWPAIQLTLAVLIVGFLIWALGAIGKSTGTTFDILGFGLVGSSGLSIYAAFISGVGIAALLLGRAVSRGLLWTRPIQRLVLKIPVLGKAIETLALARLAWSLHLTFNTGMDVRRAVRLSLQAAGNALYLDLMKPIDKWLSDGSSLHEAFANTGEFPNEFLDALDVGERSGKLVESMDHLSKQYRDRAKTALATLTMLAGFAVWCMVAVLIIALIFRFAMFYIGTINDAVNMTL